MKNRDLILVIDMQNVYLKGQKWACLDTEGTARRIRRIISAAEARSADYADGHQETGSKISGRESVSCVPAENPAPSIIFTEFIASKNPSGVWKEYNEVYADVNASAFLNEIVPDLKAASRRWPLFSKGVYSSMKVPEIAEAAQHAGRVVLTGVVSECCVLSTAFDAIDLGCKVVWLTDGVSGFTKEKEKAAELTLTGLSPLHTLLMTVDEYLAET